MVSLMWRRQMPHDEVIIADAGVLRCEVWPACGEWGWVVWNPVSGVWRGHGKAASLVAAQEAARRHVGHESGRLNATNTPKA